MDPSKFTFKPKSNEPTEKLSFAELVAKSSSIGGATKPSPFGQPPSFPIAKKVEEPSGEAKRSVPKFGQSAFKRKPDASSVHHPNFGQTFYDRKKLEQAKSSSTLPVQNAADRVTMKRATMKPYEVKGAKSVGERLTKRPIFDTSKFKFVRKPDAPAVAAAPPPVGVDEADDNPFKQLKPLRTIGSAPSLENNTIPEEKSWKLKVPFQSRIEQIKTREPSVPRSFSPESKDDAKLIKKLAELEGRECSGEYEKYSVLDERDKILYQLREINSPVIQRLQRCEEMCTEKERYMRIVQKRSSPFECDEATFEVSHQMMVKEYARSAADQERPLPHELRSEKMMEHTMSYLLHSVLDKFPETAEQRTGWYNFLWSRTRAVRKEVTQLSMSDPLALELVERCTRLHILFGYILCDLEVDHFDQKMNNENLGKCLQTLRHLYEDFEHRGIICPNEPEFRSYDVMMHMSDSNVFSQVLSYRSEVRQSEAVCLALQLSTSFQNNNYCKFFRLLKQRATFLQCCMSHKLFNEIRSNAINVITSSYGRNAGYPLDKFCALLAFDSIDDVKSALEIYGLRVDIDVDQVVLNRDFLTLNDPIPMKPYEWINSKKSGKFSQVVYGPKTFNFFATFRDVTNSFDHHNLYTKDPVLQTILGVHEVAAVAVKAPPPRPTTMEITIEQKRRMDEKRKLDMSIERMMNNVIDQVVFGIVEEETIKEKMKRKLEAGMKRKMEEERIRMENLRKMKEMEQRIARKIQENLEKQITEDILQTVILTEICEERQRREVEAAKKIMEKVWEETIMKYVDDHVMRICVEVVEKQSQIHSVLGNLKNALSRDWLLQFWNRWRDVVSIKKAERKRKREGIKKCLPKWDTVRETTIMQKYNKDGNPTKRLLEPHETELFVRQKIVEKRRKNRLARKVFDQWRRFAAERKEVRRISTQICRKQDEFFETFGKLEILRKRTFTFENPEVIAVKRDRRPLRETQSLSVFEPSTSFNTSITEADLTVARDQIESWKHAGMPNELKEKLKRRRESFEKQQNEHNLKKNKQEEVMIKEMKAQTSKMDQLSEETSKLLEDTKNFESEMREFISNLKTTRRTLL